MSLSTKTLLLAGALLLVWGMIDLPTPGTGLFVVFVILSIAIAGFLAGELGDK